MVVARISGVLTSLFLPQQNKSWCFLHYLDESSKKRNVTTLVADPAVCVICPVENFKAFHHIRTLEVPRAGQWIQSDFPEVVVEEALKTVADLETYGHCSVACKLYADPFSI